MMMVVVVVVVIVVVVVAIITVASINNVEGARSDLRRGVRTQQFVIRL